MVWHHEAVPNDAKPWPERHKFPSILNNYDRYFFLHTIYLIIYLFTLFIHDKMHTVHRFCHNSPQVDRYAHFACAYGCSWRWTSIIANFDESNQHVQAEYTFLLQNLAMKAVSLEQTAQVLIRLHRYLGKQPNLTNNNVHNVQLFPWRCSAETQVMSPEP